MKRLFFVVLCFAVSTYGATMWCLTAGAATPTATVGDEFEVWYHDGPPALAPPYAADTLHVGALLGQETDRTYLMPDLRGLPSQADSGIAVLPVTTDGAAGTFNPGAASIRACLATASPAAGTSGSTETPPSVDASVCEPVTYDSNDEAFRVILDRFLEVWNRGGPAYGIALMPDPSGMSPVSSWQVAFNGSARSGYPHITSAMNLASPTGGSGVSNTPGVTPSIPASSPSVPDSGGGLIAVPAVTPAGPTLEPTLGPVPNRAVPLGLPRAPALSPATPRIPGGVRLASFSTDRRRMFMLVFLAPLALVAGYVFFIRLFTSEIAGAPPSSRLSSSEALK